MAEEKQKLTLKQILKNILLFIWKIIKAVLTFLDKIKFLFTIPLCGIAASIFTTVILLIFKTLIVLILPAKLQIGLVETLISTVIFLILMVSLFRDKINRHLDKDPKTELMALMASSLIWLAPIYFIGEFYSQWLSEFIVSFSFMDILIEPLEALGTFGTLLVYSPHMWLSAIKQDFGITMIICYIINLLIFSFISISDIKSNY